MDTIQKLKTEQVIAYFSMEIALLPEIPTYSGGLGVLAGDTVRSAADLSLPFVAVTLLSRQGYFQQELTPDGQQVEHPVEWEVEKLLTPLPNSIQVEIEGRSVEVKAWIYHWKSITGGVVPVIFLDTNTENNCPEDQAITHCLYGGDPKYRLKQEIILGIGGVRMLRSLGFNVRKYHINEGHAALLSLELLREIRDLEKEHFEKAWNIQRVKNLCVFTTHTPVEAGHDQFPYNLVQEVLGNPIPFPLLQELAGKDGLNMTRLALNLSGYINGVAKRHSEVSRTMFPGYSIYSITNGVHSFQWTSPSFRELFDKYIPGWAHEPELLTRVDVIPDSKIWEAHQAEKKQLFELVREKTGQKMDENALTIGFARRMTAYKRPHFIFSDIERLKKAKNKGKFQIIFAGKAHPNDYEGKNLIRQIFSYAKMLQTEIPVVFLENYGLEIAKTLTSGVDVWLNTPQKPLEASGTSGMKAAHNGVLNFSILDGWWIEGCIEGVTGWAIGPEAGKEIPPEAQYQQEINDFYNKLEYIILPTYYQQTDWWIKLMKNSIGKIASYFNTHRMMKRYVTEAYFHQPAVFSINNSLTSDKKE